MFFYLISEILACKHRPIPGFCFVFLGRVKQKLEICLCLQATEIRDLQNLLMAEKWQSLLNQIVEPFCFVAFLQIPKGAGKPLPNVRNISRKLFPQSDNQELPWQQSPQSPERTNIASVFGQFLTHDITLTWDGGKAEAKLLKTN